MPTRVNIYPIDGVSQSWQDDPFDHSTLPADIVSGVTIENVKEMFNEETFSWMGDELGKRDIKTLKGVEHAIVHRFEMTGEASGQADETSTQLVNIAACLRLVRPMRLAASPILGTLRSDGRLDVQHFGVPHNLMDVPQLQKSFSLRNRDIVELQSVAHAFLQAMGTEFKFQMSVSFHDSGHFAVSYWKSRFILWCSAVEAIYTSRDRTTKEAELPKKESSGFWMKKLRYPPVI